MHVVNVFPELKGQQIEGFGGAVTEASVYSASKLAADKREEVLKGYYGEEGLRYNLARVHIHSCDFALGNYTYVEEGDKNLSSFDVAHDREYLFPFLKEAMVLCDGNLDFLASPWSPPAYMKSNGEMNHGGKLLEEYYGLWAEYYVKYLKAYEAEGLKIQEDSAEAAKEEREQKAGSKSVEEDEKAKKKAFKGGGEDVDEIRRGRRQGFAFRN